MATEWFYTKDEQHVGPVTSEQLKALAASKGIQPTTQVWKEGMPEWVPASRVSGLFPKPPPLPSKTQSPELPAPATHALSALSEATAATGSPTSTDTLSAARPADAPSQASAAPRSVPKKRPAKATPKQQLVGCLAAVVVVAVVAGGLWWLMGGGDGGSGKGGDEAAGAAESKVYGSVDEMRSLIGGRSQKEVVAILGKPDYISATGILASNRDDEVWSYDHKVRHAVTGQLQGIRVHFAKGWVIVVAIE